MSAKENILKRIREAGYHPGMELPVLSYRDQSSPQNRKETFMNEVIQAGGKVYTNDKNFNYHALLPKDALIIGEDQSRLTSSEMKSLARGGRPLVAVFTSILGVAENGATWLGDFQMANRALPFVSEYVIIFLKEEDIVWDMHGAYKKLEWNFGYGVFVAGPSKTADIEQNLVIGAHGPLEFFVIVS